MKWSRGSRRFEEMCLGIPAPVAKRPPLRTRKSQVLSYNVERQVSSGDPQAEMMRNH